ncbi:MAG: ExbD/TolR family protein [Planctomycetaceae bacterium]
MKIKTRSAGPHRIPIDMTPMIDCVFLLIIFFMLTLKIRANEGDFNINMPLGQVQAAAQVSDIKVRLEANPDGTLKALTLGRGTPLGNDERAFAELGQKVRSIVGKPGNPLTRDLAVELDPDFELNYQYVMSAISACTGTVVKQGNETRIVRYVEKIKFAPPRPPRSAR